MWLGIDLKTWLGLSALGALIAAVGSILGIVIKDYFFSRSLEKFKHRQNLETVFQRYRDPLVLSACELTSRVVELLDHYPTIYLTSSVRLLQPDRQIANSIHDPYFQKYKLVSTAYRLSSFLAWIELYRQEVTYLHPGDSARSRALELAVGHIRSDLADGQLNKAPDRESWRDTLVFREELRAIGESLIEARGTTRTVMGYSRYCEFLEGEEQSPTKRWSQVVLNFLLDLRVDMKDFRQVRLYRLLCHLVDLIDLLDTNLVEPYMRAAIKRHAQSANAV